LSGLRQQAFSRVNTGESKLWIANGYKNSFSAAISYEALQYADKYKNNNLSTRLTNNSDRSKTTKSPKRDITHYHIALMSM